MEASTTASVGGVVDRLVISNTRAVDGRGPRPRHSLTGLHVMSRGPCQRHEHGTSHSIELDESRDGPSSIANPSDFPQPASASRA